MSDTSAPNASEAVINVMDASGSAAAIPTNLGARTDMVQTLGFLKPGTVLPTPTVPYDYEKERKKEITRKQKRKLALKKKREAAAKAKAEQKAAAENVKVEEVSTPVQESKPDLNKIITEEQTMKNLPSTMPKSENKPLDTTPKAAPLAPVTPVTPSVSPSSSVQPRKDESNAVPSKADASTSSENVAEVQKENSVKPESNVAVAPSNTEAVTDVASAATKMEDASKAGNKESTTALSASTTVGRIAALDYADTELEIATSKQPVLDAIVDDMKKDPNKIVKIQSYGYSKDGNASEARRVSFQRAIKVRKYLIDHEISASRISVNAIDDAANRLNRVEIMFEDNKSL